MSTDSEPAIQQIQRPLTLNPGQRHELPSEYVSIENVSVWEFVKPCILRPTEFFRFALPVKVNEPLSFLQRLAENLLYVDLIARADEAEKEIDRIQYVAAFAVATISSNFKRLNKPFNPLLLETFEMERNGVRLVAEQVSHHPPISAIQAEGPNFVVEATVTPGLAFGFNKMTAIPNANLRLTLKRTGEVYTWEAPRCTIFNVMMGKMHMNFTTDIQIKSTGRYSATLTFVDKSYHSVKGGTDVHVEGHVHISESEEQVRALYGKWSQYLASCQSSLFKKHRKSYIQQFNECVEKEDQGPLFKESKLLWVANQLPRNFEHQFHFPYFVLSLNEMYDGMEENLPPTDCRRRSDMRALEDGNYELAETLKTQLENEQRTRARQNVGQSPLWFEKTGENDWTFTGKYWKREFGDCLDLFGESHAVYEALK